MKKRDSSYYTIAVYDDHGAQFDVVQVDIRPSIRAIAAASDLLEALRDCCNAIDDEVRDSELTPMIRKHANASKRGRAAIAKVEG